MTTPQQPDQPQAVQARVQAEDTQAMPTRQLEDHEVENQGHEPASPAPEGKGRRTRIAGVGLVFLALGLVALASWWALNTRTAGTPQADALPTNAIEMITSGTAVPQRFSDL